MRVRPEVRLAAVAVGDVRVPLRRRDVGVAEHLLDAAQVGAALEQVGGERVAQEVRMHAAGLEARAVGELAQDEKGAGAGQRAAAGVEEEIGPVAPVEMRATERHVAAERLGRRPAERDEPLLVALPDDAHDPGLEVDRRLAQADGLGDPQPRAVEELDEGAVAQRTRRRSPRRRR